MMMKKILFAALFTAAANILFAQPRGLNINDAAPVFTAKDQNGKQFSLTKALEQGPVVLIFYRGFWCPYCNRQLKKLEDSLQLIKDKGATLLAVTPETAEGIAKTVGKTKTTVTILHDEGLKIMTGYDVAFTLDSATVKKYKGYGIDLEASNGANGNNLPVPAVYIINKEGRIAWKYFDTDYSKRASVKDILEHL